MFCTECGTQIPDGAGFCPKCGKASLKKSEMPAVSATVQTVPGSVYISPAAPPPPVTPSRPVDMKSVNGVWLYEREHTLIKVTAILLMILGGYSVLSSVLTSAMIPSVAGEGMNFIGIIACIGFALAEFRCMRWAFIMPMIGRIADIGIILYDFGTIINDSDFSYFISIPTIQIIMVLEAIQLLFELAMLVLLILAQRPLSAKVQNLR